VHWILNRKERQREGRRHKDLKIDRLSKVRARRLGKIEISLQVLASIPTVEDIRHQSLIDEQTDQIYQDMMPLLDSDLQLEMDRLHREPDLETVEEDWSLFEDDFYDDHDFK
jgi:hypothetical protein